MRGHGRFSQTWSQLLFPAPIKLENNISRVKLLRMELNL